MYSLRLFCDINKEKGEKEGKNPLFSYGIIGFPQPPENWNLARRGSLTDRPGVSSLTFLSEYPILTPGRG